jgi:hypothetical protein
MLGVKKNSILYIRKIRQLSIWSDDLWLKERQKAGLTLSLLNEKTDTMLWSKPRQMSGQYVIDLKGGKANFNILKILFL